MLTTQYAKGLPDIRVNAADPGYTATDFNGHSGHQTLTEGTDAIVALAKRDGLGILLLEQNVGQALRIADRVAVMRSGRVILEESAAEMRARTSYWELF